MSLTNSLSRHLYSNKPSLLRRFSYLNLILIFPQKNTFSLKIIVFCHSRFLKIVMKHWLPDIASCCIFRSILREGFSSGFGTPDCVLRLPRRLGSFWVLSFPMSQTSTCEKRWAQSEDGTDVSGLLRLSSDLWHPRVTPLKPALIAIMRLLIELWNP